MILHHLVRKMVICIYILGVAAAAAANHLYTAVRPHTPTVSLSLVFASLSPCSISLCKHKKELLMCRFCHRWQYGASRDSRQQQQQLP